MDTEVAYRLKLYQSSKPKTEFNSSNYEMDFECWEWIENRAIQIEKSEYLNYIRREEFDLTELTLTRPKIVRDLVPSEYVYNNLTNEEKNIIRYWYINYIGQWKAKIRITVDNLNGKKDILISEILFNIEDVLTASTGLPIFENNIAEYSYELDTKDGKHNFPLTTQGSEIFIKKGGYKIFDLVLSGKQTQSDKSKVITWKGEIELKSNIGLLKIGNIEFTSVGSPD